MSVDSDALLAAGQRALEAGEWSAARSSFEAALEVEESPEALLGLGNALWWLDETEASLRCRERAYAAFRHRSDPFQATTTALQLASTTAPISATSRPREDGGARGAARRGLRARPA